MSWKNDVGGWATTGRDGNNSSRRAQTPRASMGGGAVHSALESVLSSVTTRSSPTLTSSKPKSPLLNRSSPTRTPLSEGARASPSSLNPRGRAQQQQAAQQQQSGSFIPKAWASRASTVAANGAPAKTAKVVFADRIDDRSQLMGAEGSSSSRGGPSSSSADNSAAASSSSSAALALPSLRARNKGGDVSGLVHDQSIGHSTATSMSAASSKSRWVTLYGGTCGEFHHALHYLSSRCGPIRRVHWPAVSGHCNWLHVQFVDTFGAAAAVDKGVIRISLPCVGIVEGSDASRRAVRSHAVTNAVQFGVTWCEDVAMIAHFREEDIEEEKAQRILCDVDFGGDNEEGLGAPATAAASSSGAANDEDVRPLSALDRVAQLSEASKRFALGDASSAILHTSSVANRNYANSFSANALSTTGTKGYRPSASGLYLSTLGASKAEARNDQVYVPVASKKGNKTAAEIWGAADVPPAARCVDGLMCLVAAPIEGILGWWLSTRDDSEAFTPSDDHSSSGWSLWTWFWGPSEDAFAAPQPEVVRSKRHYRRVVLHRPLTSTSYEALTNDVRSVVRPLPLYLDYGKLAALCLLLLAVALLYYTCLGPAVDAVVDAIAGLVGFIFSAIGLLFGGGGGGSAAHNGPQRLHTMTNGVPSPQWEYLYEGNFNNDKRSDFSF